MASTNTSVVEMNGDDQLATHKTDEVDNGTCSDGTVRSALIILNYLSVLLLQWSSRFIQLQLNINNNVKSATIKIKSVSIIYFQLSVDHSPQQELTMWCKWVLITDKHYYRQFVRGVSLVNLIVLGFSLPWKLILHKNETIFYIQFIFITVADFLLACIYTIAFVIRINYHWQVRNKVLYWTILLRIFAIH